MKAGIDGMSAFADVVDGELSAKDEERMIETLTDLVFLARRTAGERPLEWSTVADSLPYMETLGALGEAAKRMAEQQAALDAEVEADPT